MFRQSKMKLVLSDGTVFSGMGCGAVRTAVGEVVFNTSMVGYQEIFSDPSYAGQIVVMTYPLIGQYGINDDDFESRGAFGPAGVVIREMCDTPSNFRYTKTLAEWLEEKGMPCLCDVDTRMITRKVRSSSPVSGALVPEETPVEEALKMLSESLSLKGAVAGVTCSKRWFSRTPHHRYDVLIIDCGLKRSIVGELNRRGCNVTVVPFTATAEEMLSFSPDGILVSSGPGKPEDLPELLKELASLRGRLPILGLGLGHQLLGLSYGAVTEKLPGGGFHGGQPLRECATGRIFTAELNHASALVASSLVHPGIEISYVNAVDGTVEGFECTADRVIACEFNAEGGPGSLESDIFDKFIKLMEE